MGIAVSRTPDGVGIVYTSSDVLTGQDLLDANERLNEEVLHNPGIRYLLVDLTAVREEKIDSASLRVLAGRSSRILERMPGGIVAIVAPNDVLFGLSRMWQLQAEQPKLVSRITRTRSEAIAWLEAELARRQLPFQLTE